MMVQTMYRRYIEAMALYAQGLPIPVPACMTREKCKAAGGDAWLKSSAETKAIYERSLPLYNIDDDLEDKIEQQLEKFAEEEG